VYQSKHHYADTCCEYKLPDEVAGRLSATNPAYLSAEQVNAAAKLSYDQLLKTHVSDYTRLFTKVKFQVGGYS
jgi:hypothetical protein